MAIKTQGTNIWYVNPKVGEVKEIGCPTGFNPGDGSPNKIEVTCLNERKVKHYVAGLQDTDDASITINFDPQNESHKGLYDEYNKDVRDELKFIVGCSDGTSAPTWDSSANDWAIPTDRSFLQFDGELASFPFTFEPDSVVESEITITRKGRLQPSFKV